MIALMESAPSICTLIRPDEGVLTLGVLDGDGPTAPVDGTLSSRASISSTLEPERIVLIVFQGTSVQDYDLLGRQQA